MGRSVTFAWVVLPLLTGCIESGLSVCPTSGRVCAEGLRCDDASDTCLSVDSARCGNSLVEEIEQCDDGNKLSHDGCDSICVVETPVWRQLTSTGAFGRSNHALAYDANRGRVVSFGGETSSSLNFPSTWEWNGGMWMAQVPSPSPAPRASTALAYDPILGEVVLFGGDGFRNDTWSWNGTRWQQLQLTITTVPSGRYGHAMATDWSPGGVTLFAGVEVVNNLYTQLNDTWTWRSSGGAGGSWTLVSPATFADDTHPPERTWFGFAPLGDGMMMFGGNSATAAPLDDAWYWDGTGWMKRVGGPSGRRELAMASAGPKHVVVYGGIADIEPLDDTWLWDGASWQQVATPPQLGRRHRHAMVYDPVRRYTIMFGGKGPSPGYESLSDVWGFRLEREGAIDESCIASEDLDGDGLFGCTDPDCWGLCTPLCPPGFACDPNAPRCGDTVCNSDLETALICPEDCP